MKQNLVEVNLLGDLGNVVGKNWKLAVNSVSEAIRFIEYNSKKRLYRYLLEKDKQGVKYRILINQREFLSEKPLTLDNLEGLRNCELVANIENLKTIDIIPVIEGAGGGGAAVILGVLLVIIGITIAIVFSETGIGVPLGVGIAIAGLGLIAAGVTVLLSQPPKFEPFQQIEAGGNASYLFNGPQNVSREGGPVPVGYGRLLVGSQVIAASYDIHDFETD
jgi:predicted phage tail protein